MQQYPPEDPEEASLKYQSLRLRLRNLLEMDSLEPIEGVMALAYQNYELPQGREPDDNTLTRTDTMPRFTNYTSYFQGTLDHILYNKD